MATLTNSINYQVTIDSDNVTSPHFLSPLLEVAFNRNVHPREDTATIKLAGIQKIDSAREINIYRVNVNGTTSLKFRGMTTNPEYSLSEDGMATTVQINGLWYTLETRLLSLLGISPVGMPPNTNPYLVNLNPMLNKTFGELWYELIASGFQQSYSTGHLPPIVPYNFNNLIFGSPLTDFDTVVVNDQMCIQYQTIGAGVDRLISTALFSETDNEPFLAEVYLDITQKVPTLTTVLFDPANSVFGIGHNKTGRDIGSGIMPPPPYAGLGNFEFAPIDTIIFSEGDNIVSLDVQYDYISMSNSFVFTGGDFMGSEVAAVPIEMPSSIAEFGLKQTQKSLANVVDQDEIKRYIDTSIPFFQRPIPTIEMKPDYVFASAHPVVPGDFVTLNAPSFVDVIVDSNGDPISQQPTAAFVARIRRIEITWNPSSGEDISYTLTFPVINVDTTTAVPNSLQFMYSVTNPRSVTTMGLNNQQVGIAIHNSDLGFVESRPEAHDITVSGSGSDLATNYIIINMPALYQNQQMENNIEDVLIYGFWISVSTSGTAQDVTLNITQPDGLAIFSGLVDMGQKINILTLLNKTRKSSGQLVSSLSGNYIISLQNDSPGFVTETYTLYVEYSYIQNPSAATKMISVSEIANTANILSPTREWIYTAPYIG